MTTYWMSIGPEYHLENDPQGHEIIAADRIPPEVGDLILASDGRWYYYADLDTYTEARVRSIWRHG